MESSLSICGTISITTMSAFCVPHDSPRLLSVSLTRQSGRCCVWSAAPSEHVISHPGENLRLTGRLIFSLTHISSSRSWHTQQDNMGFCGKDLTGAKCNQVIGFLNVSFCFSYCCFALNCWQQNLILL